VQALFNRRTTNTDKLVKCRGSGFKQRFLHIPCIGDSKKPTDGLQADNGPDPDTRPVIESFLFELVFDLVAAVAFRLYSIAHLVFGHLHLFGFVADALLSTMHWWGKSSHKLVAWQGWGKVE